MNYKRRTKIRCCACNKNLNDSESTRRVVSTGEFLDLCNKCYSDVAQEIPTVARIDLNPYSEMEEDFSDVDEEGWDVDGYS